MITRRAMLSKLVLGATAAASGAIPVRLGNAPAPVVGVLSPADHAFLDLHLWLEADTPLQAAHATSHVVKDKLMAKFPQLADVVIHIEPPPPGQT